ncbi:hypothetical protein DMENIID0001_075460 [Sergentomyia squamirostris]
MIKDDASPLLSRGLTRFSGALDWPPESENLSPHEVVPGDKIGRTCCGWELCLTEPPPVSVIEGESSVPCVWG